MPARIDIQLKISDTRAATKKRYFESLGFGKKIKAVHLVDSYLIDANLPLNDLRKAAPLFYNPLVENGAVNTPLSPKKFDWAIEIGFLPGVTDNVGGTAKEVVEDFLKKKFKPGQGIYSLQVIFLEGRLTKDDIRKIADTLYNPLIQRTSIKSARGFRNDKGMGYQIPRVALQKQDPVSIVNLEVPDDELARIGKEGIENPDGSRRGPLALDLGSMKTIRNYFRARKRKPADIELESLAQTWSEHCKHTIFADPIDDLKDGLYRAYIKAATNIIRKKKGARDFCVSVFSDNSGAIKFDDKYLITHKVETHNSPSALDPFGGAITGIVGVNRDTIGFGLGAKPVVNLYGYCFADPRDKTVLYRDSNRREKLLSARRIMEGVIQGVNAGGNCSGIPTPQGFAYFDERFRGKPLVFVGTVGLIPKIIKGKPSYKKKAQKDDYIVMTGGRVGQDGIHGATFSSEAMDSKSPATAVQIGDPVTQKKLSDAIVKEARDKGLYHSITDNGAGGLSCSVAEMAKESGGCLVNLRKIPLKYPGLEPWKIWISESQERMTLAVPKNKWAEFNKLMKSRGIEATVIGKFTDSGKCIVRYGEKTVMDIKLKFLHEGRPKKQLHTKAPLQIKTMETFKENLELKTVILEMLRRPNLASREFISKQYDHEVQGGSALKPLQGRGRVNSDATIHRPVLDSKKGIILSSGITPSYSEINPYNMAASAIDTAIRGAVAAGANPKHLALLDNFCWCSSNDPERLYQLKEAVRACYDCAISYETPFISGKDSMFNDFKGYDEKGNPLKISVPPTLLISAISVIKDAGKAVSLDLKTPGDIIYILGDTYEELGGSELASFLSEKQLVFSAAVPRVNAEKNKKIYEKLSRAINKELIASAISVSRGGLAMALCKMAMGGELGIETSLKKIPGKVKSDAAALFSESQGRILLTVASRNIKEFEKIMKGSSFARLGAVTKGKFVKIKMIKRKLNIPISSLLRAYRSTFAKY